MARWQRKQRRGDETHRLRPARPAQPAPLPAEPPWSTQPEPATPRIDVASEVARLAYTPTQAARALGVSRSTFYRLLRYMETIELPWGGTLVPVDELERVAVERRRAASARRPRRPAGRRPSVPAAVLGRIRAGRKAGKSLGEIAAELNADRVPTAHGGARWWPSTIRAVLRRTD